MFEQDYHRILLELTTTMERTLKCWIPPNWPLWLNLYHIPHSASTTPPPPATAVPSPLRALFPLVLSAPQNPIPSRLSLMRATQSMQPLGLSRRTHFNHSCCATSPSCSKPASQSARATCVSPPTCSTFSQRRRRLSTRSARFAFTRTVLLVLLILSFFTRLLFALLSD